MRRSSSPLIRPLFQFGLLALLFWGVCLALNLSLQVHWLSAVYWTVLAPWIACAALLLLSQYEHTTSASRRLRGPWLQASLVNSRRSLNIRRRSKNRRSA